MSLERNSMDYKYDEELDCFKRAAELGCPDFQCRQGFILFRSTECHEVFYPLPYRGTLDSHANRVNRYAGFICSTWWRSRVTQDLLCEDMIDGINMSDSAYAFARKYGG